MKKITKDFLTIIVLFIIISWFFLMFLFNKIWLEARNNLSSIKINHPEFVEKKESSLATSFGFRNLKADILWLRAINYIWSNAISAEYKKYLFEILDNITHLNPKFKNPYFIWILLLPDNNERYESLSPQEVSNNKNNAEKLWLKAIRNFCDNKKIEDIKYSLENSWFLETLQNPDFINPCEDHQIPYYLWYFYHFHKNNPELSSFYYTVSALDESAWQSVIVLASIMQSKTWERQKSAIVFLDLASNIWTETDNQACILWADIIWKMSFNIFNLWFSWDKIRGLEIAREKIVWGFDEEKYDFSSCENFINKTVREVNLSYLDNANQSYFDEKWIYLKTPISLYNEWKIDYIPKDFQQYDSYWIKYFFNNEINKFDYEIR